MNALIVFVKDPIPGKVKTRLCPPFSYDQAAILYKSFAEDVLESALQVKNANIFAAYAGEKSPTSLLEKRPKISSFRQEGPDLGFKLMNAFKTAFAEKNSKAAIIGSDAPQISPRIAEEAFEALEIADMVLGPAEDGGYYLIALKRIIPELFFEIPWSTEKVLSETLSRAQNLGLKIKLLPTLFDIDNYDNLQKLIKTLESLPKTSCPATRKALAEFSHL